MRKSGPPKGLISYLVLELLAERPRYGYELLGDITEISGGHWEPSYGSVYPILYKFEEEGVAERVERADEPDRKYFALTDAGREELVEKRREIGAEAKEFGDVVLGFYHLYAALATDDRFEVDDAEGEWAYSERYSAWIVEQIIRHHERDFGAFERIDATPEEFSAAAERDEREEASDEATEGAEGGAADGEESNTDDSEDPESASSGAVD
ncbi:PadR family transcriptional regulator [Halorubrum lacusprofundi]|jgi:DNA-binding PadR family transcriptional regulator|uniref:Transcriptional regulator, PadR-like family n=1 Tax=Halorubrum lacusprofundi (strain ATCC 49239 / DSM 5036 / JCM 8891 / ACAM 34) TaxID=416348 RepID=B9LRB4_HALLT|nr:PadR family transcriptional regulator [Halorubrum lacusprofundi]ACM57768.1 transcriptional regulator, PadR-like family [Halorubrum lacusprofundi ATCC 49239]MCG1007077.1 PadR family transcriptional regulator [Halorubrum lacusprofundi]